MSVWTRRLAFTLSLIVASAAALAEDYSLTQFLNIQSATNPVFSPMHNEMVFRSNITGVPQVWGMPALGAYQRQVTFDTNGVSGVSWSSTDDRLMIVSIAAGGNERTQLYAVNPYGGPVQRLTHDDDAIFTMGPWARSGERFAYSSNTRNKKDFDIYEYDVLTNESRMVFQSEGTNYAADYSPDARYLLILKQHSSVNTDLYLYDVNSGQTKLLTAHSGDVRFRDPVWDAEGTGFYFITDQNREFTGLAFWLFDSTAFRWVETPEWDVEDIALSKDGSMLAWTINENGFSRFRFRDFRRGWDANPHRVPNGVIHDMTFSNDGSKLAFTFGSGARPFDIWVYETNADKMRQVTFSATGGIMTGELREPDFVEYETFDGRKIPAYWYTPANPAKKMPVIVAIHGGPESQARPDMSGLYQYFLYRGYAVLEPNVRGSSGYGKSYLALDNVRKRLDSVKDIEYAVRWLSARKDVDAQRVVAFGGSYGGFMVLSSLATYPDLWAAGVSIVGIANFVSFLENTGIYRRALREAEYGTLEADRDFLMEISPLTHADKITAPLFLIQGANDPRVPKIEADQIAEAIRSRNGVVEYLLFDDEGHGLTKLKNRIMAYSTMVDFLDRHVAAK